MNEAISSDKGNVNQIPVTPNKWVKEIRDNGIMMINCLVSVMIKEIGPFPNDSKTPDITMANVETDINLMIKYVIQLFQP